MFKHLLCAVLVLSLSPLSASAFGVKDYHKEVMTNESGKVECSVCHGDQKRKTIPEMSACEACHGTAQEVLNQLNVLLMQVIVLSLTHMIVCTMVQIYRAVIVI